MEADRMPKPLSELARDVRAGLGRVIVGHGDALDTLFLTIVCGGHALLEGVPGLGKTLAVRSLAGILRVGFRRVQCTPDLMPADITGATVLNTTTSEFRFRPGPLFTDLLLVDEINRMPPRTQAALLEAMEERQVTVDGTPHALAPLFSVIATQNPIEFEGTYPLPEAELDRFAVKIRIAYPGEDDERAILARHHDGSIAAAAAQSDAIRVEDVTDARREVAAVRVEPGLLGYVAAIVRRTRDWPAVALGASPRAGVHLMQLAKAVAATEGRDFVLPDDVKRVAPAVLRHRLSIRAEAEMEGVTPDQVVTDVLAGVPVPK
jgi:MoxR-like ATPase